MRLPRRGRRASTAGMSPQPSIFISAVSKELRAQRQLVAKTLRFLGFEPVLQDEFGAEQGNIRAMLSEKIGPCVALIQLVGQALGMVVKDGPKVHDQMSYTQFEAVFAEDEKKRVWYLLLDDTWRPPLTGENGAELDPEHADDTAEQRVYRRKIKRSPNLYQIVKDETALELAIFKMLHELEGFRPEPTPWLREGAVPAPGAVVPAAAADIEPRLRALFEEYVAKLGPIRQQSSPEAEEAGEDALIARLATKRGQTADELRRLLNQTADTIQKDPAEPAIERAKAAFARREYAEAERLALEATAEAEQAHPRDVSAIIEARVLAGDCARERIEYPAALAHYEAAALISQKDDVLAWAEVQNKIGWLHYLAGAYAKGEALMASVWKACQAAGKQESPAALETHRLWASALDDNGKYAEAETEFRRLIRIAERVLGAEHPDTLNSRNNLALALHSQGKFAEAELEHRAELAIRERVLGAEDPDTLKSRNNLANALHSQGKHAEAEQEQRTVLMVRERALGPEHLDTLTSRNNLATALHSQGQYAEAELEHRAVLALRERALGPEHPTTLNSRNNLAAALDFQGKHAEAELEHRAVLAICERVLGPEHPATLKSRNNLANALHSQGEYAEAEQEQRAVLALRGRVLGPEHPDTLAGRNNLAAALDSQGKHAEAELEHRAVLALRERVLGPAHPDVFLTCYNLAGTLFLQGKKTEALEFARRAEDGWRKSLGPDHPDTKDAERRRKRYEKPA